MSQSTKPAEIAQKPAPKKENMLVNLLLNVVIPTLILVKLSGETRLGPTYALLLALAFPIGYGLHDYIKTKKLNFFSALGVISVTLTGGMALLKLPPDYIAIKEAAIPAALGLAVMISLKTRYPLVKTLMMNPQIMHIERIQQAIAERKCAREFEKTLVNASLFVSASFLLSSVLNYGLAKYLLVSEPGTEAFNAELGTMTALSIPVITVPSMTVLIAAMFYLFSQIKRLTGLTLEDIMNVGD